MMQEADFGISGISQGIDDAAGIIKDYISDTEGIIFSVNIPVRYEDFTLLFPVQTQVPAMAHYDTVIVNDASLYNYANRATDAIFLNNAVSEAITNSTITPLTVGTARYNRYVDRQYFMVFRSSEIDGNSIKLDSEDVEKCWLYIDYDFSNHGYAVGATDVTVGGVISGDRSVFATFDITETTISTDPFSPGGTTGDDETDPEGGDGTFENEEVTVDPPALPSLSAITSGFIAAYMPSFSQLQSLGDYLWSDLFSLDTFKKLFNDPMQAILGLSLVPVTPSTNAGNVVIGNVNTGISMPRVMQQFVTVDCGSITLPEYWGGYLDYSPYTKVEIYLPYIGVRPLDTDEVMGRTLRVVYHVDVLSGACVCFIQCDNTIRYHYVGQCGASIPITANDWTRVVNGAVSIATALGVGVATLGAGAAAAGGVTAASMAGAGALVGGVASQVLASKPRVEHSGSLAGMGGILGIQFPYIMIQRPRQAVPTGQNAFTGYPSFIKRTLSTVTGYTQVTGVHLTGLSCTDEEKKEIQAYLEAGVIL